MVVTREAAGRSRAHCPEAELVARHVRAEITEVARVAVRGCMDTRSRRSEHSHVRRASSKDEEMILPDKINYLSISALSNEAKENLSIAQPQNLRQASRIPGVTPAAISILKVQIKAIKNDKKKIAQDAN